MAISNCNKMAASETHAALRAWVVGILYYVQTESSVSNSDVELIETRIITKRSKTDQETDLHAIR